MSPHRFHHDTVDRGFRWGVLFSSLTPRSSPVFMQRCQDQAGMGVCFDGKEWPILGSFPLPAASQQSFRLWQPKLWALCPPRSSRQNRNTPSLGVQPVHTDPGTNIIQVSLYCLLARAVALCQSDCRASCPRGIRQHCSPHRLAVSYPHPK